MQEKVAVKKFYTLKYDQVFKSVFGSNKKLLERLLEEILEESVEVIRILPTELNVKKVMDKVKRLDLLVKAKDRYLNIEINTSYTLATKVRNLNYFTDFYSSRTKSGDKYDLETEYIHVLLNYGMSKNIPEKYVYKLTDIKHKVTFIENFKIIEVNVDKYKDIWYDKDEKKLENKEMLVLIGLNEEEMKEYNKYTNDKEIKEVVEKVKEMNEDDVFVAKISAEEDAILLHNTEVQLAEDEGIKKGKFETAKALLADKVPIEKIQTYTGLSKETILKLI